LREKRATSAKVIADPFDAPNLALMALASSVASPRSDCSHRRAHYFGQLAENSRSTTLTEFDKGINRFIGLMIRFMLVLAPAVFLINGLTKEIGRRRSCSGSPSRSA